MFNKKKQPPIKSLIAEGSQIVGNITFTDGLRVDGSIIGNIHAADNVASILVISEIASITGAIVADHIIINGSVKGPIHARKMLELQPKARCAGNAPGCVDHWTIASFAERGRKAHTEAGGK